MRVSFLAVLAVALLAGLGVVVAVKTLGLLSPPVAPVVSAPPPVVIPPPVPRALVGSRPLYEEDFITPGDLGSRPFTEEELKDYKAHPQDYLMPIPQEAYYRFMAKTVPGNKPLRQDDLQPAHKSDFLHDRLLPGSRPVNVSVMRNDAAGGLISKNDWVDVHLITNVSRTDDSTPVRREGLLVRHAHVVARRDTLVNLATSPMSDKFSYTLSMNPYRASLLEYARTLGIITLSPVPKEEKDRLDAMAKEANGDPAKAALILVGDPNTREGMEEEIKVKDYATTGLGVGTSDVARVLQLRPLEAPVLELNPPVQIELYNGAGPQKLLSFPGTVVQRIPLPNRTPEYIFTDPNEKVREKPVTAPPNPLSLPSAASKKPPR